MAYEEERRRLPVFFYRTEAGHEPVREWLQELDPQDRKAIGIDLLRVQEQWPIGMPVCRSLRKGLGRFGRTSRAAARRGSCSS
jgi:hypothetical protein